jgi:TusA-related sulfurtransferase
MEENRARIIDIGDLSILCSTSRLGEIRRRVLENLRQGEEAIILTSDPETWYSLANLGDELGYDVLESRRHGNKYIVRIRLR